VSVSVSFLQLQGNGSVRCIPSLYARQRFGEHIHVTTDRFNNIRTVGYHILCGPYYEGRVYGSLGTLLLLLGKNSVKKFSQQ
jgi:hypothetical protein